MLNKIFGNSRIRREDDLILFSLYYSNPNPFYL